MMEIIAQAMIIAYFASGIESDELRIIYCAVAGLFTFAADIFITVRSDINGKQD